MYQNLLSKIHLIPTRAWLLTCLVVILLLRLLSLEIGDLLDPTETRYATIAKNMLISGDWISPKLPTENGLEIYLSKPPLHFWLTALSYSLFGVDEWSSRLPSFLGLALIAGSLVAFSVRFFTAEVGYLAAIICVTSPLMFFLGGSSTVDVTFAAFTTGALVSFAFFAFDEEHPFLPGLLVFLFSALSFLTKGPAGLIIIGFPILGITLLHREARYLTRLPWILGLLIFFGTVLPWFYFLERANPGAVTYYFVTENFNRFVRSDYGGRYGAAHIRPLGSIWWMAALAILPWMLYYLVERYKSQVPLLIDRSNGIRTYTLFMALGPLVFFTCAKSVLPAYTTPALPGLALYLAVALSSSSRPRSLFRGAHFGTGLSVLMVVGIIVVAPHIETNRSAAEVLEVIAQKTKAARPVVATISTRDLSPYWLEGAHERELEKPVRVVLASEEDILLGTYRHLLVRDKRLSDEVYERLRENYQEEVVRGRWRWFKRRVV